MSLARAVETLQAQVIMKIFTYTQCETRPQSHYDGTSIDTVTVVSPTGASTYNSYIPFLRQRGEASAGGCLGTSMASNGLNLAEFRGLVY